MNDCENFSCGDIVIYQPPNIKESYNGISLQYNGCMGKICKTNDHGFSSGVEFNWVSDRGTSIIFIVPHIHLKKYNGIICTTKGENMHKAIVNMYPKTEDAILVERWIGNEFSSHILFPILVIGKEKEILAYCKEKEEESKKESK